MRIPSQTQIQQAQALLKVAAKVPQLEFGTYLGPYDQHYSKIEVRNPTRASQDYESFLDNNEVIVKQARRLKAYILLPLDQDCLVPNVIIISKPSLVNRVRTWYRNRVRRTLRVLETKVRLKKHQDHLKQLGVN